MRRNIAALAMLSAGMMAGGLAGGGLNFVHPSEPSRGWNGVLSDSRKAKPKHTNRLRCSHNAKLKKRTRPA